MSAIRPEYNTERPDDNTEDRAEQPEQGTEGEERPTDRPEGFAPSSEPGNGPPQTGAEPADSSTDQSEAHSPSPDRSPGAAPSAIERREEDTEPILDRVYRTALLVSRRREDASELVAETFRRANKEGGTDPGAAMLFRILWETYSERDPADDEADEMTAADQELSTHRIEAALDHARATVARSFQQLHLEVQTVVLLLEVERISVADVAEIVGKSEFDVALLREQALSAFHDGLFMEVVEWQRERLIEDLPETWIEDSLSHVARTLGSAPEELRKRLAGPRAPGQSRAIPPVSGPPLDRKSVSSRAGTSGIRIRSLVAAALLILVVGFGAKLVYDHLEAVPESNLITILAGASEQFTPDFETDSAERLERFLSAHVEDETPVPLIEGMRLVGAGLEEIVPEVRIIGLRFIDAATEQPVTVYTLTYRFLQEQSTVDLPRDVLRQIQSDADIDLHNLGQKQVVVWRHRAHIFLAVSELDGRELRPRIYFPNATEQG